MFEIKVSAHFAAAHWLRDYEGPCAFMHGHTWRVEAAVTGAELGPGHLLIDFHDLKEMLNRAVEPFDHACLNDTEPFVESSPTSENIARYLYHRLEVELGRRAPGVDLSWVSVSESPETRVVYREEG